MTRIVNPPSEPFIIVEVAITLGEDSYPLEVYRVDAKPIPGDHEITYKSLGFLDEKLSKSIATVFEAEFNDALREEG